MTEIEEFIALWLRNHEPDGFGNGSIGELAIWHFVKDLQRGHIDVEGRTTDIKKAIDIKYYGEQKLKEINKGLIETRNECNALIKNPGDKDIDKKMDAITKRLTLYNFATDILTGILIK